jgi:hypothetical protein
VDAIASRSTDGGLHWAKPVAVAATGAFYDKSWTACDNTSSGPFYGNCYTEFDNFGAGQLIQLSTSHDGGVTWGAPITAPGATGLGGEPLAQPNGHLIISYFDNDGNLSSTSSANGGMTLTAKVTISTAQLHTTAGGFRTRTLPSAGIDKRGKVYVTWQDCRFETGCSANDIVISSSTNGKTWSAVQRIPIDAVGSAVDHFIPSLAADTATSGRSAILGLTYYYYPKTNCTLATCQLDVGFVSSTDGGAHWSAKVQLAGPMKLSWLANTNQGNMVGDYAATAIPPATTGAQAVPVVAVGVAPAGATLNEATYAGRLPVAGGTIPVADDPVVASGAAGSSLASAGG